MGLFLLEISNRVLLWFSLLLGFFCEKHLDIEEMVASGVAHIKTVALQDGGC